MSTTAAADALEPDPVDDALLAARLFLIAPQRFGGMVLRGSGPVRDALVARIVDAMTAKALPVRMMPGNIVDEGLLGGIVIAASLGLGNPVEKSGFDAQTAKSRRNWCTRHRLIAPKKDLQCRLNRQNLLI